MMRLDDITVGTVAIGGLRVRRLGYGAMRVSGARNAAGVRDRAEAIKICRRAYERGVNHRHRQHLRIYNVGTRTSESTLAACEEAGMAFLPWKPIQLEGTPAAVAAAEIADERGITSQQVALAWALAHSPAMLQIPATSKLPHLDANIDAAFIELSKDESARLESAAALA